MFIRINETGQYISDTQIHSITPFFSLKNEYSILLHSPETGNSANVVTSPVLSVNFVLKFTDKERADEELYSESVVLDNIITPLLDSKPYLALPPDGPEDKSRILTQAGLNMAIGRYGHYLYQLDQARAKATPIVTNKTLVIQGEIDGEQELVEEPIVIEKLPSEEEIRYENNLQILLDKITKALNRTVTLQKKTYVVKANKPDFEGLLKNEVVKKLTKLGLDEEKVVATINVLMQGIDSAVELT